MKKLLTTIAILTAITTITNAQTFSLNTIKSSAEWTGYSEVGEYAQSGSIDLKNGSLELTGKTIKNAEITFDTKSIKHSDKKLDKHLKEKDFFYVKRYPTAIFRLSKINDGIATGKLTMRGKTNEISFPVKVKYNEGKVSVNGKATVDRTLFDIKYNSSSYFQDLGNYAIKNTFDLAFESVFLARK